MGEKKVNFVLLPHGLFTPMPVSIYLTLSCLYIQDDCCVYLVLELLEGGDMYSHLQKASYII